MTKEQFFESLRLTKALIYVSIWERGIEYSILVV